MSTHRFPALYQINTRVWLAELSRQLQRPATFDDVPDQQLEALQRHGFDWVWFLGVWQTGPASRQVSLDDPELRREFEQTLPDLQPADISGSPFAVQSYTVHRDFGGAAALQRLRERLHARGLKLMLDFVPNHTALDHDWVRQHPDFYVQGTAEQLHQQPGNYTIVDTGQGPRILAHGRDPYFPGWTDTLQLNYAVPALQDAMTQVLGQIAGQCEGVRCDMAMLILPEIFERTWGLNAVPFWSDAIAHVRASHPDFVFMAEVYWNLEWRLQQSGFDFTYDKRLYDRLLDMRARPVREHFYADANFQRKSVRFLENHDERRAAAAFPLNVHEAAAVLTYLCPGLRFFHQGQLEGRRIRISPHLARGPIEPDNPAVQSLYQRLLACMQRPCVQGEWQFLECSPAWHENWTDDNFICWRWRRDQAATVLVCVNYSPIHSQCYVRLPDLSGKHRTVILQDLMHPIAYARNASELRRRGLYLDLPPWGCHVFELHPQHAMVAVSWPELHLPK